ncbi:MAG TPA: hypothetical protein VGL48_07850 [Acidimicrobiales bacterium]
MTAVDTVTMPAERAEQLVNGIRAAFTSAWEGVELLVEAHQGRAWEPLGLPDWEAFVAHTFDVDHVRIPKAERAAIVEALREGGLNVRAIAAATGLGVGTVHRELTPDERVPNGTPGDPTSKRTSPSSAPRKEPPADPEPKVRRRAARRKIEARSQTPPSDQSAPISAVERKAARIVDDFMKAAADPEVREAIKEALAEQKADRRAEAAVRAAQKELDEATKAQEKREVAEAQARVKEAQAAWDTYGKSRKTWERLTEELQATITIIGEFVKLADEMPTLPPAVQNALIHPLEEKLRFLQQQIRWLDQRLHPEKANRGKATVKQGTVIDV